MTRLSETWPSQPQEHSFPRQANVSPIAAKIFSVRKFQPRAGIPVFPDDRPIAPDQVFSTTTRLPLFFAAVFDRNIVRFHADWSMGAQGVGHVNLSFQRRSKA